MSEFEQIYKKHSSLVYRYLLSLCSDAELADELTAETFYRAYLNICKFRGECRVETWLCRIAKNALCKELRRRGKLTDIDSVDNLSLSDTVFEKISDIEIARRIFTLADSLKEPYKEVFRLRVIGGLQFRRIADVFGKTESWAKVTYYRAKGKIIDMMEDT